jgi:hypothetical protein
VLGIYGDLAARLGAMEGHANPKGRLQEIVQPRARQQGPPLRGARDRGRRPREAATRSPSTCSTAISAGRGTSKKVAEEEAARAALATIADPPGSAMSGAARHKIVGVCPARAGPSSPRPCARHPGPVWVVVTPDLGRRAAGRGHRSFFLRAPGPGHPPETLVFPESIPTAATCARPSRPPATA